MEHDFLIRLLYMHVPKRVSKYIIILNTYKYKQIIQLHT